jgi:hypothetical protein
MRYLYVSFISLLIYGCGSHLQTKVGPITTPPPYPKLKLLESFSKGDGAVVLKLTWPVGEYRAAYQTTTKLDGQLVTGWFYKAEDQIFCKDLIGNKLCDGGLFLIQGETTPRHAYANSGDSFFDGMPFIEQIPAGVIKTEPIK